MGRFLFSAFSNFNHVAPWLKVWIASALRASQ
jgi:hypothetical protein